MDELEIANRELRILRNWRSDEYRFSLGRGSGCVVEFSKVIFNLFELAFEFIRAVCKTRSNVPLCALHEPVTFGSVVVDFRLSVRASGIVFRLVEQHGLD